MAVTKNLKDTTLPVKMDSLKAAIVTATMRPRMKGDTLEYNVGHMVMQPNAVVEELLRRLPGLQIDGNGNITYNGQKIQHLLVDGEDIFGSDPTLITRNFDASKIARVQILDRKSDNASFTGIDDGTRIKTLNLVLKESAKNGYFGKVEVGGNTSSQYLADGILAEFSNKEQFTALALASNTGNTTLGNNGTAGITFLNGNTDALGASAGSGIPHFDAVAFHYANAWRNSDEHLASNFQYSHYFTQPVTTTQTYQTQADSIYGQHQESQSTNQQDQQWFNGIYDLIPNTRTKLEITFYGSKTRGQNQFGATGNSTFNDTLVNNNQRTIQDNVNRQNLGINLGWRTTIGQRIDRVLSINADFKKIDATTNGYLYSITQFYQPNGTIQSADTIDERKQIASHSINIGGSVSFAEPLWKCATLGLSYGISTNGNRPLQATFDRGDGKYVDLVDSLSTQFITNTLNQQATISLQGNTGHLSYTIGNGWLVYSHQQKELITDSVQHLYYFNWAPRLLLDYHADPSLNFSFSYNASTQQPDISQLVPVTNNDDPLHIILGNPGLKPGFNQEFNLAFRRFKTWIINFDINVVLTNNSISTRTTTDSIGQQISQPVNVNGGGAAAGNLAINRKVLGFDMGLHATGTFSRTLSYINTDLSRNVAYNVGGGFSLNKYVVDKYSLQLNTNFSHFNQLSSINTELPAHYWTQNHFGSVTIYISKGVEVNTNVAYTWQEKTNTFSTNTSVVFLNGFVSRNLDHNKLVVKIQLNNILNQSAGFTRTNINNINTQNSTNILGRYWMLSAIYHFDRKSRHK
jgi:Outer membrane protein beta-barrel family